MPESSGSSWSPRGGSLRHHDPVLEALQRSRRASTSPGCDELLVRSGSEPHPGQHRLCPGRAPEALKLQATDKVLEVGAGSGYQAAVLAEIVSKVFTIEIVEPLAERSKGTLDQLGYTNVRVRAGDGYQGWPTESPFDAIILTAAPDHIPQPLLDQLAIGGRLILPVGKFLQELVLINRTEEGYHQATLLPVAFVPMTGEAENN